MRHRSCIISCGDNKKLEISTATRIRVGKRKQQTQTEEFCHSKLSSHKTKSKTFSIFNLSSLLSTHCQSPIHNGSRGIDNAKLLLRSQAFHAVSRKLKIWRSTLQISLVLTSLASFLLEPDISNIWRNINLQCRTRPLSEWVSQAQMPSTLARRSSLLQVSKLRCRFVLDST